MVCVSVRFLFYSANFVSHRCVSLIHQYFSNVFVIYQKLHVFVQALANLLRNILDVERREWNFCYAHDCYVKYLFECQNRSKRRK